MGNVTLNAVKKRFGSIEAVDETSLTIEDGELLTLVGPSGCGKTTTLRMIAGLEFPSEGQIYISDTDVTGVDPRHRDIAMVFQDLALYPHMTVRNNMGFGLSMRGIDSETIKERVNQAAELMEISELLDRQPSDLSGGQQQRVALGRAIVRDPEVFLLDEPLSSLDAKLRDHLRSEILKLHQNLNVTMIYVTHDQEVAMTLGDRIGVMDNGKLQQVATPTEIYRQPVNKFVAKFIGSPDMNFFEATVTVTEETITVETPTFELTFNESTAESWTKLDGQSITFGIRPEEIYQPDFLQHSPKAIASVDATVEMVENLGAANDVHLSIDGVSCIARLHQDIEATVDGQLNLVFDMTKAHAFNPETGERILINGASKEDGMVVSQDG